MKDPTFTARKVDHLRYALSEESQAFECAEYDRITLIHDSLPEIDLADIEIENPFFIAGMTAGHQDAELINERLASAASQKGWLMGIGSQRREIEAAEPDRAIQKLIVKFPKLKLISNIGITQLIELHRQEALNRLLDIANQTGAIQLAIHLNPVQEAIQMEGTPSFKGGLQALEALKRMSPIPLVIKETGSGMSLPFLKKIKFLEPHAIDVSGLGGTHWGRVEGLRAPALSLSSRLGEVYKNWGVGTLTSLLHANEVFEGTKTEIWASGGVRSGLDAAKCFAFGADRVGFAKPALEAALKSESAVLEWMSSCEKELIIALFCTGSLSLKDLDFTKVENGDLSE